MSTNLRHSGRIRNWQDDRGFGFIKPDKGGADVFLHVSAFSEHGRRPAENEPITYQVRKDQQGRLQARRAWFAEDRTGRSASGASSLLTRVIASGSFLLVVAGLAVSRLLPATVFALYLTASIAAFILYAWDKSAARGNRRRTRERALHLLDLAGGWPGALIARHLFRHKSRKQSFIIAFWGTVAVNCIVLGWLLSGSGQKFLESLQAGL